MLQRGVKIKKRDSPLQRHDFIIMEMRVLRFVLGQKFSCLVLKILMYKLQIAVNKHWVEHLNELILKFLHVKILSGTL